MFDIVADLSDYPRFIPNCKAMEVRKDPCRRGRYKTGQDDAVLRPDHSGLYQPRDPGFRSADHPRQGGGWPLCLSR
ncbi:SRPBCC family protein [Devosia sp. A8/3-2]|nr:SRPBCC family protein [Devosia sp. A8/3-2]